MSEYKAEMGAFDRVGRRLGMGNVGTVVEGSGGMFDLQRKINIKSQDAGELFASNLSQYINFLSENGILSLSDSDMEIMEGKIPSISKIKFINPLAYLLGYVASRGGKKTLNDKEVKYVINEILPKIPENPITDVDVIRYARFWSTL